MLNSITLIGRVASEIDLRATPNTGTFVCTFTLVTERVVKGDKVASFHNIKAWGKLAENTAQYSGKGRLIAVTGYLDYEKWEKDGVKHSKAVVVADNIRFLDRPKEGNQIEQAHDVLGGTIEPIDDDPFA